MIRVFIADDQLLIRQGIRTLLEMDAEIVIAGEAEDGAETIERVPAAEVDVLLLDVRMPKKSGVDVLRELSAIDALPPTLVLTTFDDTARRPRRHPQRRARLSAQGHLVSATDERDPRHRRGRDGVSARHHAATLRAAATICSPTRCRSRS